MVEEKSTREGVCQLPEWNISPQLGLLQHGCFCLIPTLVFLGSLIPSDMNETCTKFCPFLHTVHAFLFLLYKILNYD